MVNSGRVIMDFFESKVLRDKYFSEYGPAGKFTFHSAECLTINFIMIHRTQQLLPFANCFLLVLFLLTNLNMQESLMKWFLEGNV